jgi:hypothetical protein
VTINLGSNLPLSASVPKSVTIPRGATRTDFPVTTFPVDNTTVQLSAALDNVFQFAAVSISRPAPGPSLSSLSVNPTSIVGGRSATGTITLSAPAPNNGVVVSLSNDSSTAAVPANVTVPAGSSSANFAITTPSVTATTTATISAASGGVTRTATLTVTAAAPPAPTLVSPANRATPAQPVTLQWSSIQNATSYDVQVDDTQAMSEPFVANPTVTAPTVTLTDLPVRELWWRVRAQDAAGVFGPFSATRRFTPEGSTPSAATLSAVSMNSAGVVGGSSAIGTVMLTAAAPNGGALISLSSSNSAVATVPANVTIPAGTASATFTIATSSVSASTSVTISATLEVVTKAAVFTVTPPSQPATLTVRASGRSGERVLSNPGGINVNVGSMGSSSFNTGTSITLSITNSRDAIWSGACSTGGNKAKTCTFTLGGTAAVTVNVQ